MNLTTSLRIKLALLLTAGVCFTASFAGASLNIVGYVNVFCTNGYTFMANPLDNSPNVLTNVVPFPPNGSKAYFWDVTNQVFLPTASRGPAGWNRNYDAPVGRGFIFYTPVLYTNTFVGNVLQGSLTNAVAGSNRFSLLGCMVPVGGPLSVNSNGVGFPRIDGATVHFFRSASQSFTDGFTCFTNYGWFDPKGIASTDGPNYNVAESFFVQNPGPATNWLRHIDENGVGGSFAQIATEPLDVRQMSVTGVYVTLTISNPKNVAYDVQFSGNGATWTTVSRNQTGIKWTGPLPDPVQGRFQIIASQTQGGAK